MLTDETPIVFRCREDALVGMLALPRGGERGGDSAVLVVVGGPQYRAGSHRQFVKLARRIAASGYAVLRFDVRGMGDSSGTPRAFDAIDDDIWAAIDALIEHCPGVSRVVLWGLCDGASAAALYLSRTADPRVAGLCMVNPWVRSEVGLARARVKHYYLSRLVDRSFWHKLVRGGVGARSLSDLWRNLRTARGGTRQAATQPFQTTMLQAWSTFAGAILLVVSGKDLVAQEFLDLCRREPSWCAGLQRVNMSRTELPGANHTMSDPADQHRLEQAVIEWLKAKFGDRTVSTQRFSSLEVS
jgi:exosortase A-associated hydrolase 1